MGESDDPVPAGRAEAKSTPPEDAPENALALTHVLSLQIGRAFHARIAKAFGVSIAEWRVLLSVAQRPDASANDIAEEWAMEKMAVSRAVRRLEAKNRITRAKNPQDRRSYVLAMTEHGREVFEKIIPVANARYREITSAATRQELATFRRVLIKLTEQTRRLAD